MRVRFYGARAGDGLPDESNLIYEETFTDPVRLATGRFIWVDDEPLEYLFSAVFTTPVSLSANVPYWLEIVQIGDLASTFRWEFSPTGDGSGHVYINRAVSDWRRTTYTGEVAYRLVSIPEPSAFGVLLCVVLCLRRRRGRKEAPGEWRTHKGINQLSRI